MTFNTESRCVHAEPACDRLSNSVVAPPHYVTVSEPPEDSWPCDHCLGHWRR